MLKKYRDSLKTKLNLSSFTLHILAMLFMLSDHIWATTNISGQWLTCIGRIAFPIFAFLIVEGFYHTHNRKKYMMRMFLFALISEIPFNLMYSGSLVNPFHQNVLWNFLVSLICMNAIHKLKHKGSRIIYGLIPLIVLAGYMIATLIMSDYYGAGVLMVMSFYFFRGRSAKYKVMQLLALIYINCYILAGLVYIWDIGPFTFEFPQQGFAVFALIPIWLYNGRQGPYNKVIKNIYYWFYPVHALLLALLYL